jgi:uncharacterized protein
MRLVLHGGFGEKGRTSVAVESDGYRLLLDAGVKTSARGRNDYYPAIAKAALSATDAIVITHGHEDHVAALGWCIANGFRGRIFMTAETQRETDQSLVGYALPEHQGLVRQAKVERLPANDGALMLGPLRIATGHSGHIAGGVWCSVDDGRTTFVYCGDVVPASPIFAMDPIPRCNAIALDASYGDDDVSNAERVVALREWIAARPMGCVLPTPLYGRSAELLFIVPGRVALAPGMREALQAQISGSHWLVEGTAELLAERLGAAVDWHEGMALPPAALLCHDGMGMSGPSRRILEMATAQAHPTLFTGHVPANSPGERMMEEGRAAWIRLPTHPTLSQNIALLAASAAATVLGHSCEPEALARLARHVPSLRTDVATGDSVDL